VLTEQVRIGKMPAEEAKQLRTLIYAFWNGEHLTALEAVRKYGILALSQRCTELRNLGWGVHSKLVRTETGKHVAQYWLAD